MKLPKRLSDTLTRKRKQFWCLHLWKKGDIVDIQYGKGFLYRWTCKECEKVVYRFDYEAPISMILPPDSWEEYKKDPLHRMSPPIIKIDD